MTAEEKIDELLRRKEQLDEDVEGRMAGYNAWMVDVLELLLRLIRPNKP